SLPSSWSQVTLTLKTRGGLEYLSFDDLYNKLMSLEIDVKGGSSYGSRSTTVAPTHFAFIGAASTNTKMTEEAEQVYGLMAGFESDFAVPAGNAAGGVNPAAVEFAMMGISLKAKIEKQEWEIKFVESLARFDKWQESSKNLAKLLYCSMSTRTKLGLGFKEYIRLDEVCDLSTPSVFDPKPDNREVKSLYGSDKSSASETYDFASCVSSPKTNDSFTVDVKLLPKSDVKYPEVVPLPVGTSPTV
nr:ribonuclease H-like domain, reverse transcriptase, RNA-dependent DNA polymerase [Tanacetum cinerariifolium]